MIMGSKEGLKTKTNWPTDRRSQFNLNLNLNLGFMKYVVEISLGAMTKFRPFKNL
jgi:hypothetical protein